MMQLQGIDRHIDAFVERSRIDEAVGSLFNLAGIDENFFQQEYERVLRETIEQYNIPEEFEAQIRQYSEKEALSMAEALAAPFMKAVLGLDIPDIKDTLPQRIRENLSSRQGQIPLVKA